MLKRRAGVWLGSSVVKVLFRAIRVSCRRVGTLPRSRLNRCLLLLENISCLLAVGVKQWFMDSPIGSLFGTLWGTVGVGAVVQGLTVMLLQ